MTMSNAAETALLNLLFNNSAWANVGDASGLQPSAAAGNFWVALHTADPGEAGSGSTSEASYAGYARVQVTRNAGGFTVSGNTVSNTAALTFPACSSGSQTLTHFSIVVGSSGASQIIVSGALSSSLAVSTGIAPYFAAGQLTATAD